MAMSMRGRRWALGLGLPLLAIAVLVAVFRWDWLIPIVQAQASARLGRPVTIEHLHVHLGKVTSISAEGLRIDNPEGFEAEPPFAAIPRASLDFDVAGWLRDRSVAIPVVTLEQPVFEVIGRADGKDNYTFDLSGPCQAAAEATSPAPKIGALRITGGQAHVAIAKLRADFRIEAATEDPEGEPSRIVAKARGTYAAHHRRPARWCHPQSAR
jgi:uncharacterized protein involved in outer membrane biogenesis